MSQPTYEPDFQAVVSSRIAQADWLQTQVAQLREAWSFERHPFMERWFGGGLSAGELRVFAAEHYHAVVALEDAARRAAGLSDGLLAEQLARYADDLDESLDLWLEFAVASGWGCSAWYFGEDPLPRTAMCAHVIRGSSRSLSQHLVTIYALESALAPLAPRQLEALTGRYGFDDRSVRYFAQRAERSADAALTAEAGLTSLLPLGSASLLLDHVELAYRSYAELLSGAQAVSP